MRSGWYQVAFERELNEVITPLGVEKPLVAVRCGAEIRVFDAICPHRGAHLGYGGTLDGDAIVCPFHGRRIGVGASSEGEYRVAEYPTLTIGGLVFARLAAEGDEELPRRLRALDSDHYFVAGFTIQAPVPAELVVENGFDATHFQPVHAVCTPPQLSVVDATGREVRAEGTFVLPESLWQRGGRAVVAVPYSASALSPGIILSHLGGDYPYHVLTAATPVSPRESVIRLSIIVPAGPDGGAPDTAACEYVLTQSRRGLEKDLMIWHHMALDAPQRYAIEDAPVVEFRRYVGRFPLVS